MSEVLFQRSFSSQNSGLSGIIRVVWLDFYQLKLIAKSIFLDFEGGVG
jgi:hypothetical protein